LSYAIYKLSSEINKRSTVFQQYLSKVSSFTQEIFSGIRVIKAYSLEDQHQNNMVNLLKKAKEKFEFSQSTLVWSLMLGLIGISNLVVIYFGGVMYIDGRIESIGTIVDLFYNQHVYWPVASLGWISLWYKKQKHHKTT
jgi:ATP-binding cassette subfamily B protein